MQMEGSCTAGTVLAQPWDDPSSANLMGTAALRHPPSPATNSILPVQQQGAGLTPANNFSAGILSIFICI